MLSLISKLSTHVGEEVTIRGWVNNKRSSGKLNFIELRDGSGYAQAVVAQAGVSVEVWSVAESLTQESSLILTGTVSAHPRQEGVYEIQTIGIEIIQIAEEYPISKKEHGPDFLLDHRHLWLRSKRQWAIQRVRDVVIQAVYDYFHEHDFVKIDTPIITPNACEGATELFAIDYFDEGQVYLSQSGQLYLEAAIMSVGRGFDFGPTFRAEKSKTKRHLTEFWMMDAEAAFVEHDENMDTQEAMVKYIVARALERCQYELTILERDEAPLRQVLDLPFTRLTYTEAIDRLHTLGSDIVFGEDLGNDDETTLTRDSAVPIFIHKWPKKIKPFYMKVDPANPELVLNNDLICIEGAGEIIGGSEREDDYDKLRAQIERDGLVGPEYEWYMDLRRYGSVPHSGFGLGLERMVGWISGVEHVRETIPFPRVVNRVRP
jgi:asparaginyl-tRNA synthetase